MLKLIAETALAPGLVVAATLAGGRWGPRTAGLISGLPVVVGPLLFIAMRERGLNFAATTANGLLLGLPALGGFALAYARAASCGPAISLLSGWTLGAALAALIGLFPLGLAFPAGFLVAAVSLTVAFRLMPEPSDAAVPARPSGASLGAVLLRMGATAALVLVLWTALALLGPTIGGILAALPTVVSVLAVSAHYEGGPNAAVSLLRGALAGMASFVGFCAAIALLLVNVGAVTTFAVGTALGIGLQAVTQLWTTPAGRSAARRTPARVV